MRPPLFVVALASLVLGLTGGLARLGWLASPGVARIGSAHGALMSLGFFSTVIGLETAVKNERLGRWVYALPALSAAAAFGALISASASAVLGLAASVVFVVIGVRASKGWITVAAASCWVAAGVSFLASQRIATAVPTWTAFLVLVILDERVDPIALRAPRSARSWTLRLAVACLVLSSAAVTWFPDLGARSRGLALVALAAWFFRHDVASARPDWRGLAGYETVAMVSAYFWLASSGLILVGFGFAEVGPTYDAAAHAVFLGMAFSMIFAHAPRVFPKLTGVPFAYAPDLYVPLALLHGGLAVRVFGDLLGSAEARSAGGLVSVVGIALFPAMMAMRRLRTAVSHG